MQEGHTVSIIVSTARNARAGNLLTASVVTRVSRETEKAVELTVIREEKEPLKAWFPKKALVSAIKGKPAMENHHMVKMAHWFKASRWQEIFCQVGTTVTVV